MIELGVVFLTISTFLRALGPDYAGVVRATLDIATVFFVAWLVVGLVAVAFQRPLERRILRHA